MRDVADDLRTAVSQARPRLEAIRDEAAALPCASDKWSRKEILGHLVDSALNNNQRFVRAQLQGALVFPGYEQDGWVERQGYAARPWSDVIALWSGLNLHLAHVMERIPEGERAKVCRIGDDPPVTLEFIVRDYVVHLRHHLEQILG
jgi:hypothetical protein